MPFRLLPVLLLLFALIGCYSQEDIFLDPGIPRVVTPNEKIAFVRTKWYNDKHIETAFLDSSDRVLEVFRFGRTNSKMLNQYQGNKLWKTICHYHSDSSQDGWVTITTTYRKYNSKGQQISELTAVKPEGKPDESTKMIHYTRRYLGYTDSGDTIVKKMERNYELPDSSNYVNVDRWEQDDQNRIARNYRLYVMKWPSHPIDTIYHYSQRYAYDSSGKLATRWYDYMYLGRFYRAEGPDTVWFSYNAQNRLVKELHRYTTSMSNKSEPTSEGLTDFQMESRRRDMERFSNGDEYFQNNDKTDTVRYQYEVFDPNKHLPLKIPTDL
ncbi:hypothetical protein [Persicitalea sp.]|uniref:hypothetical protein n=1 Tax=Persicitalea sp. TaxID=3100273 RepID=UPI003593AE48